MSKVKLTRAEMLKKAGIERYGSEELWRKALSDGAKKADYTTPRGFAVMSPELRRELASRGGKKSKRGTNESQKTTQGNEGTES